MQTRNQQPTFQQRSHERSRACDVTTPTLLSSSGSPWRCRLALAIVFFVSGASVTVTAAEQELFVAEAFTAPHTFTSGAEGPAVDAHGNLYAVNFKQQMTIGMVTPKGRATVFLRLPNGSTGNGIRFDSRGNMLIADYVNHNVLKVNMRTSEITTLAHNDEMNQPNDLSIAGDDTVFASDPNWGASTGNIWRIRPNGEVTLLRAGMGTTNGVEVSPDDKVLYVNESVQRNVWAFDLDDKKNVLNKRLLIQFPDFGMDGMRCDAAGNLYITRHQKGTVAIVSPDGEVLREVKLAGKNPTNIAFGGPDGRTCYVTVADQGNVETFRTDVAGRAWTIARARKNDT